MFQTLGLLEISIIIVILAAWIWGIVDLLRKDVSRHEFYKWLGIILVMPVVGFILYSIRRPWEKNP
jgi:sensor histidine kinase YesM